MWFPFGFSNVFALKGWLYSWWDRKPISLEAQVLHLYETFGWWRSPELRAVHAVRFRTAISRGVVWGRWGTGTPSQKKWGTWEACNSRSLQTLEICLLNTVFGSVSMFHVSNSFGHWFLCIYVYIVLLHINCFFSEAMVTTYYIQPNSILLRS